MHPIYTLLINLGVWAEARGNGKPFKEVRLKAAFRLKGSQACQTSLAQWAAGSHTDVSQIRANRFARIHSQKSIYLEALGQIRANRVFPPIRIQIRVLRVQSSLLSNSWKVESQKEGFFLLFSQRESIRANRPTKVSGFSLLLDTSGPF